MKLDLKELIAKVLNKLSHLYEPQTLAVRPISGNQTSDWTYAVPQTGILYLTFVSTTRTYCGILWNNANIGDVAIAPSGATTALVTLPVKKGDTIKVTGLTSNCFLSGTRCCLITYA